MPYSLPLCKKCNENEVEQIDDWLSKFCGHCNDQLIQEANERREWNHYHPGSDKECDHD